jgi:haloacid dehalogenase-like hydrolase
VTGTRVALMLADVDGTLVISDEVLTDRTVQAVSQPHRAGIRTAITSGNLLGVAVFVTSLRLHDPIGAFNGRVITVPDMTVHGQRLIPADLLVPIATPVAVFQPGCMDPARRGVARLRAVASGAPDWPDHGAGRAIRGAGKRPLLDCSARKARTRWSRCQPGARADLADRGMPRAPPRRDCGANGRPDNQAGH